MNISLIDAWDQIVDRSVKIQWRIKTQNIKIQTIQPNRSPTMLWVTSTSNDMVLEFYIDQICQHPDIFINTKLKGREIYSYKD